jgi:hypothetical protein
MKWSCLVAALLCLFVTAGADEQIDRIYGMYRDGRLASAEEAYRALPQISQLDGNRLFLSALFASDGDNARDMLQGAIRSGVDGKYADEARFRLIELAEAAGDTVSVLSAGDDFLERQTTSAYRDRLLAMLIAHAAKDSPRRQRYLDLLYAEYPDAYFGHVARLADAQLAMEENRLKAAADLCRQVTKTADDDLLPVGLVLLAKIALAQGDAEQALTNYNILKEQYRYAIGQEDLVLALKDVSETRTVEDARGSDADIQYTIQVGVFSEKDNAERMADRVQGYGYKTRISRRTISGKVYHVVLAGQFATLNAAQAAKAKLEAGEQEVFKVVVDDEQ